MLLFMIVGCCCFGLISSGIGAWN